MAKTYEATFEEIDATELGLGIIDVEATLLYDYTPGEEPDFRERGYARGYPGSPPSVNINSLIITKYTNEDGDYHVDNSDLFTELNKLVWGYLEDDIEYYESMILDECESE